MYMMVFNAVVLRLLYELKWPNTKCILIHNIWFMHFSLKLVPKNVITCDKYSDHIKLAWWKFHITIVIFIFIQLLFLNWYYVIEYQLRYALFQKWIRYCPERFYCDSGRCHDMFELDYIKDIFIILMNKHFDAICSYLHNNFGNLSCNIKLFLVNRIVLWMKKHNKICWIIRNYIEL